ncbi:MAG: L-seryl-tRNA(Sec) selenium transferase [Actinobacteria bacterium]|nr:L-seryl-tRNA(Sec) selenium transferase [Actinomycetota bacterium]
MTTDDERSELLKRIPQVNELIERMGPDAGADFPRPVLLSAARRVLEETREMLLSHSQMNVTGADLEIETIKEKVLKEAGRIMKPSFGKVINATGVVLHTNLGRAPLSPAAIEAVREVSEGYSNLEHRLDTGERGSRQEHLEPLLCRLTGAEAAVVVNNNAAAVLLVLSALAREREVIVSRGQLVEIGDSFRLPDIMKESGAVLVEVGTTNRTSLADYGKAIGEETALIMRIHQSNFRIVGYTEDVSIKELVELGRQHSIPVAEDLGSGSLVDLDAKGLSGEHTAGESIKGGADLVTFSADKLLGGPQAGIIVGSREYIESLLKHPLARALRVDKMTVAALEATLLEYLDPEGAWKKVPALRMLAEPPESVKRRAARLKRMLDRARPADLEYVVTEDTSRAGGGTLPTAEIQTFCLSLSHKRLSGAALEEMLRKADPGVLGRLKEDRLLLDLRTVADTEVPLLADIIRASA